MSEHQVTPGQIYEACHPGDGRRRIRIVSLHGNRAEVDTIDRGPARRRSVLLNCLHPAGTTVNGHVRRTGYRLLDRAERSTQ